MPVSLSSQVASYADRIHNEVGVGAGAGSVALVGATGMTVMVLIVVASSVAMAISSCKLLSVRKEERL